MKCNWKVMNPMKCMVKISGWFWLNFYQFLSYPKHGLNVIIIKNREWIWLFKLGESLVLIFKH